MGFLPLSCSRKNGSVKALNLLSWGKCIFRPCVAAVPNHLASNSFHDKCAYLALLWIQRSCRPALHKRAGRQDWSYPFSKKHPEWVKRDVGPKRSVNASHFEEDTRPSKVSCRFGPSLEIAAERSRSAIMSKNHPQNKLFNFRGLTLSVKTIANFWQAKAAF